MRIDKESSYADLGTQLSMPHCT